MLNLLKAVANPTDYQVATNSWRFATVKPPPFAAEFIEAVTYPGRRSLRSRGLVL